VWNIEAGRLVIAFDGGFGIALLDIVEKGESGTAVYFSA